MRKKNLWSGIIEYQKEYIKTDNLPLFMNGSNKLASSGLSISFPRKTVQKVFTQLSRRGKQVKILSIAITFPSRSMTRSISCYKK